MTELEEKIPKSWRFYSADFSVPNRQGHVLLKRDEASAAQWLELSEEQQETVRLFASGSGMTIEEAFNDAIERIDLSALPNDKVKL